MLSDSDVSRMARAHHLMLEFHQDQVYINSLVAGGTPYPAHIMEVAALVQLAGADVDTVCAAYFHRGIRPYDLAQQELIFRQCGQRVLKLALECAAVDTPGPWQSRKNNFLATIPTLSYPALAILIASRLQNVKEIWKCYWKSGNLAFLEGFEGGVQGQKWFHETIVFSFRRRLQYMPLQEMSFDSVGIKFMLAEFEHHVKGLFHE
jgi:hypothetical protein